MTMTTNNDDISKRVARYMCMRAEGELASLTEQQYLDNLNMIGVTWHGPLPADFEDQIRALPRSGYVFTFEGHPDDADWPPGNHDGDDWEW